MHTYRFLAELRVRLQDGSTQRVTKVITLVDYDVELARYRLDNVATELCDDAGSLWFDAPVDTVTVLAAELVEG